jgi:hypothetical protein
MRDCCEYFLKIFHDISTHIPSQKNREQLSPKKEAFQSHSCVHLKSFYAKRRVQKYSKSLQNKVYAVCSFANIGWLSHDRFCQESCTQSLQKGYFSVMRTVLFSIIEKRIVEGTTA